jgi:hypothetical protein
MTRYLLLFDSYGHVFVGRLLWREDGSVFCICCWPSPAQSFSGPSPLGLAAIFYCLSFETSLFVASYDSQGHGGGIRPRLHTGFSCQLRISPLYPLCTDHTENVASLLFGSRVYSAVLWQRNLFDCCFRIRCRGNVFTESLPSNEHLFWFRYSCFRATCHSRNCIWQYLRWTYLCSIVSATLPLQWDIMIFRCGVLILKMGDEIDKYYLHMTFMPMFIQGEFQLYWFRTYSASQDATANSHSAKFSTVINHPTIDSR